MIKKDLDNIFGKRRSVGIAYLFHFLFGFGVLGAQKFYLNRVGLGILYFFTGGLFGIGAIYDFFTLAFQVRRFNEIARLGELENRLNGKQKQAMQTPGEREKIILRIAKAKKGVVTPMDIALDSPISMDEAKKELENFVSKGFADIEVSKTGIVVYRIFGLNEDEDQEYFKPV